MLDFSRRRSSSEKFREEKACILSKLRVVSNSLSHGVFRSVYASVNFLLKDPWLRQYTVTQGSRLWPHTVANCILFPWLSVLSWLLLGISVNICNHHDQNHDRSVIEEGLQLDNKGAREVGREREGNPTSSKLKLSPRSLNCCCVKLFIGFLS